MKRTALPYRLRIRCEHRDLDSTPTSSVPTPSTSKKTKKKKKTQNWKDKVAKTNPGKKKKINEGAKIYSRYYRAQCASAEETLKKRKLTAEEKEEAQIWLDRKIRNNETARIRMERMNKRKKSAGKNARPTKPQTRNEHEKSKAKEATKKRKQRAEYSQERKEAVLARRRDLYALQNKKAQMMVVEEQNKLLKEVAEQLKEKEEQLRVKEAELQKKNEELQNRNDALPDENALDFRTYEARNKALERARKSLPTRRSHSINTSLDLINKASPTKTAAFRNAGISTKNKLEGGVMEAIAIGLQAPRKSASRKSLASTLSEIKKFKLQREFCRRSGTSRKLLQKAKKREHGEPVRFLLTDK